MSRLTVNEQNKRIAALEAKLNRGNKSGSVMADLDVSPNTYFLRRPSGIMALDIDTGGGLPAGGLTYLSGPDGAGKTFLLYKYIAMNQRLRKEGSFVALAVSEAAPDHFFMRKCGIQVAIPEAMLEERIQERKERGLPPFTKEQLKEFRSKTVGTIKLLRGAHGEELLNAVLACFDTGVFQLICLDSVSALLPEADAAKDLDEAAKRAAVAGTLTRFFQHYLNGTTGYKGLNETTVIFTSQVRSNSKKAEAPAHLAKYLPDYTAQGAWAARHGKLVDILVKPGAKEKEDVAVGDAGDRRKKRVQVGKTVQYEITKGKAGMHEGITGEFDFHFPANAQEMYDPAVSLTDDQRVAILIGMQRGIIRESGGFLKVFNPVTQQPYPHLEGIGGIEQLVDAMRRDFELEMLIRRAILSTVGIECAYR